MFKLFLYIKILLREITLSIFYNYICKAHIVPTHENQHFAKVGQVIFTTNVSLVNIQLWIVFLNAVKPNIFYSDTSKLSSN